MPLALLGLLTLPLIWILLRTLPPPARRQLFPPVSLLLEARDQQAQAATCPLWLRLLRIAMLAAATAGIAEPYFRPSGDSAGDGNPILILFDGGWAGAAEWDAKIDHAENLLHEAKRSGRQVAVRLLTEAPGSGLSFQSAEYWQAKMPELSPEPWMAAADALIDDLSEIAGAEFDSHWISDGLHFPGLEKLAHILLRHGEVRALPAKDPVYGLRPAAYEEEILTVGVFRTGETQPATVTIEAVGVDTDGQQRVLVAVDSVFGADAGEARAEFPVPLELANRIQWFRIAGIESAGAISLVADSVSRRRVALFAGRQTEEGASLTDPLHFLRKALSGRAELVEAEIAEAISSDPDTIILADVMKLSETETALLGQWVEDGGLLIRFAGPRTAAGEAGALFPVRLRSGSRSVGGAMSWESALKIRPPPPDSPFHNLAIPEDVTVRAQLLAQPGPELSERVLAEVEDGTPLVTASGQGAGRIVLFHVTANSEWSNLPLSGLFPAMLGRLMNSTAASGYAGNGSDWQPQFLLDAFGNRLNAGNLRPVAGEVLARGVAGPELRPGIYKSAGVDTAVNAVSVGAEFVRTKLPPAITTPQASGESDTAFGGFLIALALSLLAVDILASVRLGGRISGGVSAALACVLLLSPPAPVSAETSEALAVELTRQTRLAFLLTGDARTDAASEAGLYGLARALARRTSVELGEPYGINPGDDELAFFPLLYWPVRAHQQLPESGAVSNLNNFLRNGGTILFDTADSGFSGAATGLGNSRRLRELAGLLDVPSLQPLPDGHVLTRSFYRLDSFPGRYDGPIWVEEILDVDAAATGMPVSPLDGVTPVVVGGNDWAAAWAESTEGRAIFSTGPGAEGRVRRELAIRFGINLIMHVLSGNYKSDQLQIEALFESAAVN